MDKESLYNGIVALQRTLEADHDDLELMIPDCRRIKALAACYELRDYLANAIAGETVEPDWEC